MKHIFSICAKLSVVSAVLAFPASHSLETSPLIKLSNDLPATTLQEPINPAALSHLDSHKLFERHTCTPLQAACTQTDFWYENIDHNGVSPFIPDSDTWTVFRNVVTDFGAVGDGVTDDWEAFQNAINYGNSFANRSSNSLGTTGQPAVVYIPSGTYMLSQPLQLFVGTVVLGNPINRPTLKATGNFSGSTIMFCKDPNQGSTTNFYIGFKNIIIDSTNLSPSTSITLMDWSVSQATQLTNVAFNMPDFSTGHVGLAMPEGGSGTIMNDLTFNGGAVGISYGNQQYMIKSVVFTGCTIGILVNYCFDCVFQNLSFEFVGTAIDMTSSASFGSIIVLDSTASSAQVFVNATIDASGSTSIVIENFSAGPGLTSTVTANGTSILTGSVTQTWVYGNAYLPGSSSGSYHNGSSFGSHHNSSSIGSYHNGSSIGYHHNGNSTGSYHNSSSSGSHQHGNNSGSHQHGTTYPSNRVSALLDSAGKYQLFAPPTYDGFPLTDFINVKNVEGFPVAGDGVTDDTLSLNAIAAIYAGCKILFFPAGTYIVSDTVTFPRGSRVVGEVWSAISATGKTFSNPDAPTVMVRVGEPGDIGVAQFSDFLFTVAEVLPGCILLEVNIAGENPGDVGFWNSHFRVGGAAGSTVETSCGNGVPDQCKAAFMLVHLTATSSAYIEDMWGWTADHDLDSGNNQIISTGRGMLIEATQATWLVGTAFEHNTLYQYNLHNARNVYIGMQQSETPYWQGTGAPALAPAPWTNNLIPSDPTFSSCDPTDAQCRMALFQTINGGEDLFIFGSGFWTFFNAFLDPSNPGTSCTDNCQTNAVEISGTKGLKYYGVNTRFNTNLIVNNGVDVVLDSDNLGGWGGVVAAFLADR